MITRGGGSSDPESGALDLPLEPGADLARRGVRVPVVRAEPPSARRPVGQPAPAPARLRDRRLGALGQRVLPADRRARLRRHLGGLLPALPRRRRRGSGGCSPGSTCSPACSSRSRPASAPSCCCTGSRRRSSARTRRGAPSSTWRSARWPCSSARSTASRSTSCSPSPRSRSRSAGASSRPGCSWGSRSSRARPASPSCPALAVMAWPRRRALLELARGAADRGRVPARPVAAGRRPVGLLGRPGPLAPPPLVGRAARRDLGRRPRALGPDAVGSGADARLRGEHRGRGRARGLRLR